MLLCFKHYQSTAQIILGRRHRFRRVVKSMLMAKHTINFSSWELGALLRCLESLKDHELQATAETLRSKILQTVNSAHDASAKVGTAHQFEKEASRRKTVVRDRTNRAKESGM